jgi:disulfide bond formation protein DsbB
MIIAIFLGTILGIYGAYMIKIFHENKNSKYILYIRFFIIISMSTLGPLAIYIIRIFEGVGSEGDPPLSIIVVFGISLLGWLLGLLFVLDKRNN